MKPLKYILFLFLLVYACRTVARNEDYRSAKRYWFSTAECSPYSPRSHLYLGYEYFKEDNIGRAMREWQRVNELNPDFYECWANLGMSFEMIGRKEDALKCYEKSLELKPEQPEVERNYQKLKGNVGR